MDSRNLLTVSQAAEACNATSQTIRNWIRSDRLHAVRIGHRFLIPREEVERILGDSIAAHGDDPWDHAAVGAPEPLRRKSTRDVPSADPTEGLLGA